MTQFDTYQNKINHDFRGFWIWCWSQGSAVARQTGQATADLTKKYEKYVESYGIKDILDIHVITNISDQKL